MATRIILFLTVLAIGGFDRHISYYFPGVAKAIVQADGIPAHGGLPEKSCNYHEDIALKAIFYPIPAPMEFSVGDYRIFHVSISHVSRHTVWQPPEKNV